MKDTVVGSKRVEAKGFEISREGIVPNAGRLFKLKLWTDSVSVMILGTTHTQFITPGGKAERATNASLLIHFSSYTLISLEPIQRRYPPRYTVLLAC